MPLPSTGPLSINDIRGELGAASTNQSLGAFSDTAGFASPDTISDFRGYSAISTGLTSALYTENLSSNANWLTFDGSNEIDLTPYRGTTSRLVIHYTNGTASTSYRGDFQIGSIVTWGASSLNFQYSLTDWQTTRTNTNNSSYSNATWYTLADGTSSGRWNRRNTSAPPSSATGLAPGSGDPPGTQYYAYTDTSGGSMLGYGFWFRSPAVTFPTGVDPDLEFAYAHYGSNVGSFRVYFDVVSIP